MYILYYSLIEIVTGVINKNSKSQPGLLSSGNDLVSWKSKSIATSVTKLKCIGVLDTLVVGPVNGSTTGLVCKEE